MKKLAAPGQEAADGEAGEGAEDGPCEDVGQSVDAKPEARGGNEKDGEQQQEVHQEPRPSAAEVRLGDGVEQDRERGGNGGVAARKRKPRGIEERARRT